MLESIPYTGKDKRGLTPMKKRKLGLMLFAVALGTFMSALDASVVNISVPVIKAYFGVSLATVQ